jgi:hypothetical protein
MKITKEQLKEIIKEEIEALSEVHIRPGSGGLPVGSPMTREEILRQARTVQTEVDTLIKHLSQEEQPSSAGLDEGDKNWMKSAFSKKKGSLHKALGVPEDKDISVTKMASALRKGGKTEKKARAAVNANPDKYGSIKDVGVEKKKKKTKK